MDPASIAAYDASGKSWYAMPLKVGAENPLLYVVLYATGVRNHQDLASVHAAISDREVPVIWAGPSSLPGVDHVTVGPLPPDLAGAGDATISVRIGTQGSNTLALHFE